MFMYVSVRMNVRPCLVNMITQTSKAWMNLMGVSIGRGRGVTGAQEPCLSLQVSNG